MNKKSITVSLAQAIGSQQIAPFEISATDTIPEINTPGEEGLNEARRLYAGQAKMIADTLYGSLPGGTLDALLIEMLDRKRSLFRVPFECLPVPPIIEIAPGDTDLFSAAKLVLNSFAYTPGHGPEWYETLRSAVADHREG